MKARYFNLGRIIKSDLFEEFNAPMGWIRKDLLIKKLKENEDFRSKFNQRELIYIYSKEAEELK